MQAVWNNKVIAEANKDDLIYIEGNWYFPPNSIKKEFLQPTDEHTTCFWKGKASYYDVSVDKNINKGSAFYYPKPQIGSKKITGKDFTNYVAFWRGVEVKE